MYVNMSVQSYKYLGSNLNSDNSIEEEIQHIITLGNKAFFSMALRSNAGHGLLILEVSRSHTTTHHSW